jgi:methionyl-tRNA synthetase
MSNFYITSPIYYVNDVPHIGHAYTSVACDVIACFKRLQGDEVFFLTGTDEHGQKVEKSALARGKNPQQFCDEVSQKFRELAQILNLSNDDFIRTTEERHKKCAQEFWCRLEKNGWIYKGTYEGWYAVRDEAFYAEDELVNGKAPSGAEVVWQKEETRSPTIFLHLDFLMKKMNFIKNFGAALLNLRCILSAKTFCVFTPFIGRPF